MSPPILQLTAYHQDSDDLKNTTLTFPFVWVPGDPAAQLPLGLPAPLGAEAGSSAGHHCAALPEDVQSQELQRVGMPRKTHRTR